MMKLEHNTNLGIEFFKKINNIRESPVSYSLELEQYKESFKGKDFYLAKRSVLPTQEGVKALDDLIKHFSNKRPIKLLKMEKSLNLICEEFCNQAKCFEDMSELNNTFNFEKSFKKYGKINNGRYMNIMFNMLTSDSSKNSFLFLSCDGDDTREYRDLLTVDLKISQIGIHVVHFENETSPVALILLVDDFSPDPLYENDAKINNLLGSSNLKTTHNSFNNNNSNKNENMPNKSVKFVDDNNKVNNKNINANKTSNSGLNNSLNSDTNSASKNPEVKFVDGSNDPDLNLKKGVIKIEKSQRILKEAMIEYIVTKTVTYMDDGEIKTTISKEKLL
jgi:hypothetical protein